MKLLHITVADLPSRPGEIRDLVDKSAALKLRPLDFKPIVEGFPWTKMWDYIHSKAISQQGLDISEVGSTWVSSLVGTEALRPFAENETAEIFSHDSCFDASMHQAVLNERTWSIPWTADTRVIYYRRSRLREAGIDESQAFSSIENTAETMARLKAFEGPGWGAPTFSNHNMVYLLAPWVWARGGEFVSRDNKRTAFCEKRSIEGLLDYFNLAKYVPREFHSFEEVTTAFKANQVAAMIDGSWIWTELKINTHPDFDIEDVGLAPPPGPAFVGGSNLVIWRHAGENTTAAVEVIKHLSLPENQILISTAKRLLPVHQAAFRFQPYSADPAYRVFMNALKTGRSLPTIPIWAQLENSLVKAFGLVWEVAKHNDFQVTEANLLRYLEPLAKRFDTMMPMF